MLTVALLLTAPAIAGSSYTTECSPKRMVFPGAEATDICLISNSP